MIKLLHVMVMKSETRDAVCGFVGCTVVFMIFTVVPAVGIRVYSLCATAALSFCNCISFGLLVFLN